MQTLELRNRTRQSSEELPTNFGTLASSMFIQARDQISFGLTNTF